MNVKTVNFPPNVDFKIEVPTGNPKHPMVFLVGGTGPEGECVLDIPDEDVKLIEEAGVIDVRVMPMVPVNSIKIKVGLSDGALRAQREMGPCYTMGAPQRKEDKVLIQAVQDMLRTCKLVSVGKQWRSAMDGDIDAIEKHLKRLGWRD